MNIGSFDLIKELGYEDFSEENKKKILGTYSEILETRISSRILQELNADQQKELDELIKAKKEKEADEYIAKNVEDFEFIIRDEVRRFKRDVLEQNEELKKAYEKFQKENPI